MDQRRRRRVAEDLRRLAEHDGDWAWQAGYLGAWYCHHVADALGIVLPPGRPLGAWVGLLLDELADDRTRS